MQTNQVFQKKSKKTARAHFLLKLHYKKTNYCQYFLITILKKE